MPARDEMGRDEGGECGPEPGKGAVIHSSTGEADFDGLPGDALPPKKMVQTKLGQDQAAPAEKAAD